MENIAVYCSWADQKVLSNHHLCAELSLDKIDIVRTADDANYFDNLARAILNPRLTDQLFILYEPIVVELAARLCSETSGDDTQLSIRLLAFFARILPAKPCLEILLQGFIKKCQHGFIGSLADSSQLQLLALDFDLLSMFLLALFRLYSYNLATHGNLVSPVQLSSLLRHEAPSIRYLAIRCLALYMKLADALLEKMVSTHVPEKGTVIKMDGHNAAAWLFSLWEEQRWNSIRESLAKAQHDRTSYSATPMRFLRLEMLSPQTAALADVLLPRLNGISVSPSVVTTPTTTSNLKNLAIALLGSTGVLLIGPSGSGKTSLVAEAARLLNKLSSMITLHLNEQTDVKSLLGIYTTSPFDASFTWQPGVLTRAMMEGRWVLIEDIHRAPPEVISLVLAIIEHGEILMSSPSKRIRAATGFCVLATTDEGAVKKSSGTGRVQSTFTPRLWNIIEVEPLQHAELEAVLISLFPLLEPRISSFLSVHRQVQQLLEQPNLKASHDRHTDLRVLFKWCRRSQSRLKAAGLQDGAKAVEERVLDYIFKDAVICYAGHIPSPGLHDGVVSCIAQVLQVPSPRMRHCIYDFLPSLNENGRDVSVGRASCPVINSQINSLMGFKKGKTAFALTRGTLKTLEEIATAVQYAEPTLLVGETGIGKTAVIQYLAALVGQKLSVFNLSQQSEGGDLIGGFKPITTRSIAIPMAETFELLFDNTFSNRRNIQFQASIRKSISRSNWHRLISHWQEAVDMAGTALRNTTTPPVGFDQDPPNKKRRLQSSKHAALRQRWQDFAERLSHLKAQVSRGDKRFAMAFVEGKIVRALRDGEWVLLDEINLATPETLESIVELLQDHGGRMPSLLLSESGRMERVEGHRNFRIFATMNPATDSGKRELPAGIRKRFTEIFIQPGDTNLEDLTLLISTYLGTLLHSDEEAAFDLANCYLEVQRMNDEKRLTDGAGHLPHFSIRSLVRTLIYANQNAPIYGLRRASYEGFQMAFVTTLNVNSEALVTRVLERHLLGGVNNARSLLNQNPKIERDHDSYVVFKQHLVKKGNLHPESQPHYIITPFVERNLLNLARAVSVRRFPILLQGPTSSGKTSMVEYLAKVSGNEFIRINNHEHTDLQEYLGSYSSGEDGRFQYREGVLVEALRRGQWIVLDELNLAPTDVLEALNRLLDDNRELYIPATQETVKPHPNFLLFATQNPAGLYGGRKHLSRAFRNRFLELHFDDIPEDELEFILKERAQIAPSFCSRIVSVYKRLSMMRQSSRLFEQRNSFATLRDLFRWASRKAHNREELAVNGFMLLAERVRDPEERTAVKHIIEDVMKVEIDDTRIYSSPWPTPLSAIASDVIWTPAMRRLLVLVTTALENNEPVLLVGDTGCGKTQICQTVAEISGQCLHILNAHSNTETGDLIGSQRPIRNKAESEHQLRENLQSFLGSRTDSATSLIPLEELINRFECIDLSGQENSLVEKIKTSIIQARSLFEWADGSLIVAMKRGEPFLLDEISLAEDSVLERLNSVLEPDRSILLAEKGPDDSFVRASPGFQFLATMNPGGDYGKRELSSALRNRLTEIWVPPLSEQGDILPILQSKLGPTLPNVPHVMIEFAHWFRAKFHTLDATSISLREMLTWVEFVRANDHKDPQFSIVHGAGLVFIDSLGAHPAALSAVEATDVRQAQQACVDRLGALLHQDVSSIYFEVPTLKIETEFIESGSFRIPRGSHPESVPDLVFDAPTTRKNAFRILRALQISRPLLLEGDPGVGKTALIEAIAQASRKRLTRMNLSEQTDLMDLFGSDVPVEGGSAGDFGWRDGPFLRAMSDGDWVLLDEMNLATQSVLEGLNSCLDHRKQVYITELDRNFVRHPDFVLFAAQNPHHQGGGRKGLSASFVNRFTVVYADALVEKDLMIICQSKQIELGHTFLARLISAVSQCHKLIKSNQSFDSAGGPWEINLRDIHRWLSLYTRYDGKLNPTHFSDMVLSQRFRTPLHRSMIRDVYTECLSGSANVSMFSNLSASFYQLGDAFLGRNKDYQPVQSRISDFPPNLLPFVRSMIHCINEKWPVVLVGGSGSGKSTIIRQLAVLCGAELVEFPVSEDLDTMDLLGGFEQIHQDRVVTNFTRRIRQKCLYLLPHHLAREISAQSLDTLLEAHHLCNLEHIELGALRNTMTSLARLFPEFDEDIHYLEQSTSQKSGDRGARFGWTDGVLVEAVTNGNWLVLDNANTCNSAVLDRLNSLLEPNASLIVSEQSEKDGSPRFIKPHSNFRIFLTMDPRRGGLSRAMRNRSVEIFLDAVDTNQSISKVLAYPTEAAISRWRRLQSMSIMQYEAPVQSALAAIFVDHLSLHDLCHVSLEENNILLLGEVSHLTVEELAHYSSLPRSLLKGIEDFYIEAAKSFPLIGATVNDQPMHTESNELLIQMVDSTCLEINAAKFGWLLESFLTLCRTRKLLSDAKTCAASVPHTDMTLMERSVAMQSIQRLSEDGIGPLKGLVEALASATEEALSSLMTNSPGHKDWRPEEANTLLAFLRDLVQQCQARRLRPGLLSVYLQAGRELFSMTCSTYPMTANLLKRSLAAFGTDLKLRYGQSLCRLWSYWRPRCARSSRQLEALLTLDEVMQGFDSFRHKAPSLRQMVNVQRQLLVTRDAIFKDTENMVALLEDLQSVMKLHTYTEKDLETNYFAAQFEALCQYQDLVVQDSPKPFVEPLEQSNPACAALLAGRNTKYLMFQSVPDQGPAKLARIASFAGWSNATAKVAVWKGTFAQELLGKLNCLCLEPIKRLDNLTAELSWLLKVLSNSTRDVTESQLEMLRQQLLGLVCGVVGCHKDLLTQELQTLISGSPDIPSAFATALVELPCQDIFHRQVSDDHYFRHIWKTYLRPALSFVTCPVESSKECSSYRSVGASVVLFSMASLQLSVPDRPTDPALGLSVQRDRYQRRKGELEVNIQALKIFETTVFGQNTSLRIRRLEQDLDLIGLEPPPPPVVRLEEGNLLHLQADFSNIVNGIVAKRPESVLLSCIKGPFEDSAIHAPERAQEIGLLKSNIKQILGKLSQSPREYDDLAVPVVQLLQILDLGATMLGWSDRERLPTEPHRSIEYVADHTPLFGATPASLLGPNPHNSSHDGIPNPELLYLETASLMTTLFPWTHIKTRTETLLSFESCYASWNSQLRYDQAKEANKARYYDYRHQDLNDQGIDSEEINMIFPTFDDGHRATKEDELVENYTSKALTLKLANLHASIFAPEKGALQLKHYVLQRVKSMVQLLSGYDVDEPCISAMIMLPALFLSLEKHMQFFHETMSPRDVNIYADPSIHDARKLADLVHRIVEKIEPIRKAWPEHAVPIDILERCKEILRLKISDPIANLLAGTDKLHAALIEWQAVASGQYSVAPFLDDLTAMIINWRRQELSSWARLLGEESRRCEEDAKSWWFVVYQVAISIPVKLLDQGDDCVRHAQDLVDTLIGYLQASNIGQFSCRLQILENFHKMTESLIVRGRSMEVICSALSNVIKHFRRYEPTVKQSLAGGRERLEQEIREQIKLASWKDTNVVALRESARRSHHKLFKIVKKYRALLARRIEKFSAPDADQGLSKLLPPILSAVALSEKDLVHALHVVEQSIVGWCDAPRRFREPWVAAGSMLRLYHSCQSNRSIGSKLHEYVFNLKGAMTELKSQSPSKIQDADRALLLHLKARKRRLFADVLKDIRHMGIRRNLNTAELERQLSLGSILGAGAALNDRCKPFGERSIVRRASTAEYYFHGFLDLIDRARKVQDERYEHLNSSDVGRCIGSLEGFLLFMQTQRDGLNGFLKDLALLQRTHKEMYNVQLLGTLNCVALRSSIRSEHEQVRCALSCLPSILGVACDVLEIQMKHADHGFAEITGKLKSYQSQFDAGGLAIANLLDQAMPYLIQSQQAIEIIESARGLMATLHKDLDTWIIDKPDVAYLLKQLLPWTEWKAYPLNDVAREGRNTIQFNEFRKQLSAAIDKVFVGMQTYRDNAQAIPNTVEDARWLLRSDQGLTSAIRSFRLSATATHVGDIISSISSFDGVEFQMAVSLCTLFSPIIQQFYVICEHAVEEYADLHAETCRLAHTLVVSFNQIAYDGFCGPASDSSDTEESTGQLGQGTGLGDGEGVEDISKDVDDDEDLSELAQQHDHDEKKEEIAEDENAVDMGKDFLEGEMDDHGKANDEDSEGHQASSSESEDNNFDDEIGSVSDLDPSAVDEKLWEGLENDTGKQLEGQDGVGKSAKDKAAVGDQNQNEVNGFEKADEEDDEEVGVDDEIDRQPPVEQADPHLEQEDALEIPDAMQLDGDQEPKEDPISDDELEELPDANGDHEQEPPVEENTERHNTDQSVGEESEVDEIGEEGKLDNKTVEDGAVEDRAVSDDNGREDDQYQKGQEENHLVAEDYGGVEIGASQENAGNENDEKAGSSGMALEVELSSTNQSEQATTGRAPQRGSRDLANNETGNHDNSAETREAEVFKRLGDVLERWHRQRHEILESSEENRMQTDEIGVTDADFEHVRNEQDHGASQALGGATKDQAQALDETNAIEDPQNKEDGEGALDDDHEREDDTPQTGLNQMPILVEDALDDRRPKGGTGSEVGGRTTNHDEPSNGIFAADDLEEVDHGPLNVNLSKTDRGPLTSPEEAIRLWSRFSSSTHPLSLILTEQLRLILSPTQATRLRGDFRTGKRLNVKRIIPYIASQYKRDKIWMRRSVPTKRNYQIMIAVDDSKSMMEGGAYALAFKTIALLCKSLSMLEVGEVCVVSFGDEEHIRIAHSFGTAFTNESGASIYQNFSFQQSATNVKKLIQESIHLFREARARAPNSNIDLWQLQLIISDGIYGEHDLIRRLVLQASEERIMIVFVVVDSNSVHGNSIMDLTQAVFEPEAGSGEVKLRMKRYLDGFPFPYYVIVRDVGDLPGVLATALKGWFREVMDVG